ncbi:aspartyl-phosphate phosphatase Spo0E family protein [Bacillus rubiinfantis]|uniref:aspartyl-phosphate phosphatase Spo0E family protein n=1 Tax=Bacillus rubiinfantis TaxID=1499680 RepID=UPI0005A7EE9A|nr:aspartyl-phosphate phosphatase Spo0E family protein [Bacillus rubiinfantis]
MIEEIKVKRELMIKSANKFGFTSDETIKYSQELDELINEYHRMMGQAPNSISEEVKFAFKKTIMIWPKVLV